ncbi:hypothetical protein L3X38_037164 [Prunus dulcis]|uniref:Uncharacterized protein n=1 Tax=Prunus dulcis TaxID=3755 RepID=A0AAD4V4J7_PRUDU|nr:hypothetical protein L3X38_037164 [Prunus dulcis]
MGQVTVGTRKLATHLCSKIGQVKGEIMVEQLCTKHKYTKISKGNKERGNWLTTYAVKSGRWLGKSLSDTCVLSTGTQKYFKATWNGEIGQPTMQSNQAGGWGNYGRRTNCVFSTGTRRYLKATGNWETGKPLVQSNRAGGRESLSDTCVLSTGTCKYLKATWNRETGQPPMLSNQTGGWGNLGQATVYEAQSNRAGGFGNHCRTTNYVLGTGTRRYLKATGNGETSTPLVQSNQAGGREIIIGHPYIKYRYTQISKDNWEQGNWPTTCAFKSERWLGKSLLDTCELSIGTYKYLKATGNGETGQPPVQSNRAGGWGNHGWTSNCVLSTATRKYLKATGTEETSQPIVQSNWAGLRKYLKATGNGESDQPLVQSNRAGGLRNRCRTPVYEVQATENGETSQPPVKSNRSGGFGNHCRTANYVLITGTRKCIKATGNRKTGQPYVHSNRAGDSWPDNNVLSTDTRKYLKATRNGETGQPHVQPNRQVARKINVEHLCTEYKNMQIFKGNWERENWPTTCAVKSGSHGRVLGLGGGVKAKDAYYSSTNQNCNKRRCLELEENHGHLKEELNDVKGQLSTLQQQVQMLINNNPQNSAHSARQSPNVDNVGSYSNAYLTDDVMEEPN